MGDRSLIFWWLPMARPRPQRAPARWREDPRETRPMLAELTEPATHDRIVGKDNLVFEPKYDGIRALVDLQVAPEIRISIYSRLGNDKSDQFPELVEPLARLALRLKHPVLLDGEIVATDDKGHPLGFQHLQGRLHVRGLSRHRSSRAVSVAFIAFDLLRDGADDIRALPFAERRARLATLLRRPGTSVLRLIESTVGGGEKMRAKAERSGWEGIVAKDPNGRYFSGRRHAGWRKLKFITTEEFVVGGWTEPRQSRRHFGALLLGYVPEGARAADGLVFAGQVGSGFTDAELDRVAAQLAPLITPESPFVEFPRVGKGDHWVTPTLVAQTKFTEWTMDGLLRNPVYLGLRDDKNASDIRLPDRRPNKDSAPGPVSVTRRARTPRKTAPVPEHPEAKASELTKAAELAKAPELAEASELLELLEQLEQTKRRGTLVLSDGSRVPVGNLHKVFWPDPGITKGELLRFYLRMAPYILPVVEDRPLVMKRFPNGVDGKSFYQHRAPDPLPDGLRVTEIRESPEKADSGVPYLIGGRPQALLYMAQLAVLSQDPWFSRLPDIINADQVALDLDPMPGATFRQTLDVACWLHDELEKLGTPSFPKTSGSEGVHIFIPLPPGTPYEAGMIFCQILATVVATAHPEVATVERMVKRRRSGTIYIDYLQNIYGKTLACAYSARASEFAGVSTPLTWTEVHDGAKSGLTPKDFTIRSIFSRLDRVGDLWSALRTTEPADLEAILGRSRP